MKLIFIRSLTIISLALIVFACDRPECINSNPVFDLNPPTSKVYKDELVKKLETIDQSTLTFWLKKYESVNEKEQLYFYIQGENLCAEIVLTMKHWNKLERVRAKKGVSFRGAQFTDLKFDIYQGSTSTDFVYRTYGRIID